jgi:hypothetical protein
MAHYVETKQIKVKGLGLGSKPTRLSLCLLDRTIALSFYFIVLSIQSRYVMPALSTSISHGHPLGCLCTCTYGVLSDTSIRCFRGVFLLGHFMCLLPSHPTLWLLLLLLLLLPPTEEALIRK